MASTELLSLRMMLAVAVGGAVGTLARYLITVAGPRAGVPIRFPWWTFVINVTGSFALGFLARYFVRSSMPPSLYLALTVGVCGGYTTFSTFSYEMLDLGERGLWGRAIVYSVASVVFALAAAIAGAAVARAARGTP